MLKSLHLRLMTAAVVSFGVLSMFGGAYAGASDAAAAQLAEKIKIAPGAWKLLKPCNPKFGSSVFDPKTKTTQVYYCTSQTLRCRLGYKVDTGSLTVVGGKFRYTCFVPPPKPK